MESDKERRCKEKQRDGEHRRRENKTKRARTRSRSPRERDDRDARRKRGRSKSPGDRRKKERNEPPNPEVKKEVPERKAKETDMLNTRTGGAYIPPARLRMMQAQITDKSSIAYQRLAWEALKKSIHGHINKINVGNIGIIIKQLLKENIVRGRGLLCRSVIQAQAASPTFTNVYAALVAAVNSRFPNIGELLLKRLVVQFKRGFKRNDKPTCISSASFIAHLVNQRVAHEILALELLTLLVETPTDDSVEVAIAFLKESGQKLTEVSSKGINAIFEMLRNILHEGQLDKRVQYMIEVMFQVWKDGFKDHPALIDELELVPEEDQFTHLLMLDDATDSQDILNVFKFDDKFEENEQKYKNLCKEILGSDVESGEEGGSGSESGDEESDDEEQEQEESKGGVTIIDNTETNLVALRRTIYLTINSSLDFEECAHKLMKMQLKPGQEIELCHMFLDCCAEQRTYEKFYGLLAQRFCNINRIYVGPFEEIFKDSYGTAHRLDTNRLRNVSKFFAHLLFTDAISWEVLECVKLNEEDTTSSSRIYIKILFQELAEYMGLKKLNDRLRDPTLQGAFSGIFPRDNPKNTRFSINFFTSIGLGGLTDELREHLKQMPKNVLPAAITVPSESSSSSDSSSDSSSSGDSSSDSSDSEDSKTKKKSKKNKKKGLDKTNKSPEPTSKKVNSQDNNKENDRWGHDGFYDTYGTDARRIDPQTNRRQEFAAHRSHEISSKDANYNSRDNWKERGRNHDRNTGDKADDRVRRRNEDENNENRTERQRDSDFDRKRRQDYNYERERHRDSREDRKRDETENDGRKNKYNERDNVHESDGGRKKMSNQNKGERVDKNYKDKEVRRDGRSENDVDKNKIYNANKDDGDDVHRGYKEVRQEERINIDKEKRKKRKETKDDRVDDDVRRKKHNETKDDRSKDEVRRKKNNETKDDRDEDDARKKKNNETKDDRGENEVRRKKNNETKDDRGEDEVRRKKSKETKDDRSDGDVRRKKNNETKDDRDTQVRNDKAVRHEQRSETNDERKSYNENKVDKGSRNHTGQEERSKNDEGRKRQDEHKSERGNKKRNDKEDKRRNKGEEESKYEKKEKQQKRIKESEEDSWDRREGSVERRGEVVGRYWDN